MTTEHDMIKELAGTRLTIVALQQRLVQAEASIGLYVATLRELAEQSATLLDAMPTIAIKGAATRLVDGYSTALKAASCLLAAPLGSIAADVIRCTLAWAAITKLRESNPRVVSAEKVREAERRLRVAATVLRTSVGFDERVPGEQTASDR